MNLATLLEGPATLTHRGQLLHFRGGLTVRPLAEVFDVASDLHGVLSKRALENSIVISGTPIGVFSAGLLEMTHRWQNPAIGSLVTPRYDILSATAATDVIVLVGDATPRAGCPVLISAFPGATLPGGIVAGTLYYWSAAGKIYDTEAHAITDDGTGKIDLTDAGAGDLALIEQEYIRIDAISANRRLSFHNGAVTVMPPVILSAVQTIFGAMSFACFLRNDVPWATDNSLYTVAKMALSDTAPNPANIPTQEYSCVFGAAPWDAFKSRGPVTLTPQLATEAIGTDSRGNVGLRISGISASATFTPQGFSQAQLLDVLSMQGGTAARGASRVRGDLVISGTGVHATVYNGTPRELPQTFQATGPLAGELAIDGCVEPGSGAFRLATAAP